MGNSLSKDNASLTWKEIIENRDKYVLVDIRNPEDYQSNKIEGSINLPNYMNEIDKIKEYKKPVVISCYKGCSSKSFVKELKDQKIEAYNAKGGIEGYEEYKKKKTQK